MDAKAIEKKVIKSLSETRGLPIFGLIERIFGAGLVPESDTDALTNVLRGLVKRGVLETDAGWYRLADGCETAASGRREADALLTAAPGVVARKLGRRKAVRT